MERKVIKLISNALKKLNIHYDIELLRAFYIIIINIIQLLIIIIVSIILNVFPYFALLFLVYLIVRTWGESDHFDEFIVCFKWSNVLFISDVIGLWLTQLVGESTFCMALFLGVISAISTSSQNKLTGLFSFESKGREEINLQRAKVRLFLMENWGNYDILTALNKMSLTTDVRLYDVANLKYGERLSNKQVADRLNLDEKTVRKIDEKIVLAMSILI